MNSANTWFSIYLILINGIGFSMMGIDKRKAIKKNRRIPERRLFLTAIAGGVVGVWGGMWVWRHKTKHRTFSVGIPMILILQAVCVFLIKHFV